MMTAVISILIILLCSVTIYYAGNYFTKASSLLGDKLHLPRSVKGVTFDAISSSLPELLVAIFGVIFFHRYDIGIGTIVGSALFNILVIPGLAVLIAPIAFTVHKKVIKRDAVMYIISIIALIIAVISSQTWTIIIPIIFLMLYSTYGIVLYKNTKSHKKRTIKKQIKNKTTKIVSNGIVSMIVIAGASYLLTEHAILVAEQFSIHPFVITFTVIAAATSIPDTIISVLNAKKGDITDAAANVFGSNTFDILIGLSIPALLATSSNKTITIFFERKELLFILLASTLLVYSLFSLQKGTIKKWQSPVLLGTYILIITYVIIIAKIGII